MWHYQADNVTADTTGGWVIEKPPLSFTTNANESVNAVLKNQEEYKWNDVLFFFGKAASCNRQTTEKEVQMATIDTGKYRFLDQYKNLMKNEDEWFLQMTLAQRQNLTKKIAS